MKQRKLNQHSCIIDKVVDRISTRKLHFSEMCSKIVQSSLNVGYLVLDEFNDRFQTHVPVLHGVKCIDGILYTWVRAS